MHNSLEDQSQMKYDNLARSLSMIEDELKRANERVQIAEERLKVIEQDLESIGENQIQLEKSEEKARRREEKYQEQIHTINIKLKQADSRAEYAEMNISKLHHKIDELEVRTKLILHIKQGLSRIYIMWRQG